MRGHATTTESMCQGQIIEINARTVGDGEVLAELVDENGNVPAGFSLENSDAFKSDTYRGRMTWRGISECPQDGLRVRFYIRQAFLYGFEFTEDKTSLKSSSGTTFGATGPAKTISDLSP